ncbi:EXS-domain-containing protein [Martensiomyces pterosporus]|nr:EXS-domain-containing protein [Martensiomyces pterosporus]
MFFPIAFQVLFLALLATFGWAANLQLLSQAGIEVRPILQLSHPPAAHRDGERVGDGLHQSIYRLAAILSGIAFTGWILCAFVSTPEAQTQVTLLTYLSIVIVAVLPQRVVCHTVRMQFIKSLVRIVKPSLSDPVYLSDVIMADILTSCARMLADMCLVACQFGALQVDAICSDPGIIGAILVASPYVFRLRQCVNEYLRAPAGSSDAKRHFANAVKYASSLPVICLSATQKRVAVDGLLETKSSDWALRVVFGLWIAAVAFNSLYSFYWDIAFDWDLGHRPDGWKLSYLIAPATASKTHTASSSSSSSVDGPGESGIALELEQAEKTSETHVLFPADAFNEAPHSTGTSLCPLHWMLRPRLCFSPHTIYYFAMVTDFLLRVTWAMKLSSHIQIDVMAYGGFWLNVFEIYRRWQWTFLRIEKEAASEQP